MKQMIGIILGAVAFIATIVVYGIGYRCGAKDYSVLAEENEQLREETAQLTSKNSYLRAKVEVNGEPLVMAIEGVKPYEPAAEPAREENQLVELESGDNDEILQANAISSKERLPEGHTNVISGMPYTSITDKKSEQWALQLQAYTGKYGIRCYFDGDRIYFLSAMGSAYGRTIGDTFRVTLRCGTVLYVMLAEFKDDGTDPNFFGHPTTHADGYDVTCVLEFIYDAEHINSKALQAGNFCNIECFGGLHGYGGDIVKIEYLGRRWEP